VTPSVFRIALGLAYDGAAFEGWQTQPHGRTVQDHLEKALSSVAGHFVHTVCAGRTDAGVHASAQIIHFETMAQRPLTAWVRGANSVLPSACRVLWAQEVDSSFDARFSAQYRCYDYWIYQSPVAHPFLSQLTWVFRPLDVQAMQAVLPSLLGEHDFSAFRAARCQASTPVRHLQSFELQQEGHILRFTLKANAFLYHMVRNLIGTVLEVGWGNRSAQWPREVLQSCDRRKAAKTAPAAGLSLVRVGYHQKFDIPQSPVPNYFGLLRAGSK
jgi:tRNA pseudouridine38-40 synthase